MTKRDDRRKDDHSGTVTRGAISGACARSYYFTSWRAPDDLTPDKDNLIQQSHFNFGPGDGFTVEELDELELTAEEAAALDSIQKEADAENTEWRSMGLKRIKLLGMETDASMRIARPPGSLLATISEFVFSKKTLERVVNPIIADMQAEYCEALAAKRPYKAAWIRVSYCWSFAKALGLYSVLKAVVQVWRKIS